MDLATVFLSSMQEFLVQLVGFVPKLIVALIIWIIGKYLISWAVMLLKKVKLPDVKPLKKLVTTFIWAVEPIGKIILVLVVLDYLGIGRTVIQALLSGLSFAIAIALGIAFGRALEPDAKDLVSEVKKHLEK